MLKPQKLLHGGPADKFGRSFAQIFEFGNTAMKLVENVLSFEMHFDNNRRIRKLMTVRARARLMMTTAISKTTSKQR
jgi:hypothetical protein